MCIQEEPRNVDFEAESNPVSGPLALRQAQGSGQRPEDNEEEKPHLSKSQMDRYLACPRSHHFSSTMKINPLQTPINLLIGSATHRGIAAHYLARKNGETANPSASSGHCIVEAADEIWQEEIGKTGQEASPELLAARNTSYGYINLFLQNVSLDPIAVETRFEIPIVHPDNGDTLPCNLVGIVDLVDKPGQCPRPIEIKTRAAKAPDYLPGLSLELTCYAYWIWHNAWHNVFSGKSDCVPVGYIHIIKTKTPYIQKQEGVRGTHDFIDFYNTAKHVYESIAEGRIHKSPGMHCTLCDYLPICTRDHDLTKTTFGNEAYQRLWEAEFI